jgi:hypothetical protein
MSKYENVFQRYIDRYFKKHQCVSNVFEYIFQFI